MVGLPRVGRRTMLAPLSVVTRAGRGMAAGMVAGATSVAGEAVAVASGTAAAAGSICALSLRTARNIPVVGPMAATTLSDLGSAGPARGVAEAAGTVASGTAAVAGAVRALPARVLKRTAGLAPAATSLVANTVGDLGLRRSRRRAWSDRGRAHIEVRGLTGRGPEHRRLAEAVTSAFSRVKGVDWSAVNAVTQQVLVSFDEDEVDLDDLVGIVESVEGRHDTDQDTFSWSRPLHPGDVTPVNAAGVALAADLIAFGVAVSRWLAWPPRLPYVVRVPIVLVDAQPRVRAALGRRIGVVNTDLFLAIINAMTFGLARQPVPLAMDALYRSLHLAELLARRSVWTRRESELSRDGTDLPRETHEPTSRPAPLRSGPIEKLADRASVLSLLGAAGVLAWTRDPRRAAYTILVLVPRAARLGREAFAAALGRDLARRGVVPLDGAAYRRLDRMDVVVIDSEVLCGTRPQVLSAEATGTRLDNAEVWRTASRILRGRDRTEMGGAGPWEYDRWRLRRAADAAPGRVDGPTAMALDLTDEEGTRVGRVRIGCELDPLADALLGAARGSVDTVVLTEHDSVTELLPWADEVLPGDVPLTEHVRTRQADGHGVVLVAAGNAEALTAADVAIGVLRRGDPTPWTADLVTGPGLAHACRLMHALSPARKASERTAQVAVGGSALAALIASVGSDRQGVVLGMAPLHTASLLALGIGVQAARHVARLPEPEPVTRAAWHAITAEDALLRLTATKRDLAARETAPRALPAGIDPLMRRLHVPPGLADRLPARMPRPPAAVTSAVTAVVGAPFRGSITLLKAMGEELHDPLTPVLALGAAASAVVGSSVDAWLVSSVMTGNAAVSSLQRIRAEHALSKLLISEELPARRVIWTPPADEKATDVFEGLTTAPVEKIPSHDLSVGDVILLGPSDVVPADARLLYVDDLEVDESSLTGESLPVMKTTDPTPAAGIGDRTCMVYEGSAVLAGTGYAVVVATGAATQSGRATAAAGRAAPPAGVQVHLSELTRVALPATGIAGLAVTGLGLVRGGDLRDALSSGIAVAVAAVPEGLPLVATVSQLAAARRLSRRGVLVRSSRSLEALGRVDTICFDKTGTLTEGRLAVTRLAGPAGDVGLDSPLGRRLLQVAAHASPQPDETGTLAMAHATDRAIVEGARVHHALGDDWWLIDEQPFATSRGFAASLGKEHGRLHLAVKGAPEVVLARCASVLSTRGRGAAGTRIGGGAPPAVAMTPARQRAAQALVRRLAEDGLRVLAVAERHLLDEQDPAEIEISESVEDLTLLGFVGIADVARPSAAEAVRRLSEVGVRVTMITGDHPITAVAIAKMLEIPEAEQVLTGAELDVLPEGERVARIAESTVFARVSPEQKVDIVKALQRAGHVVAMTGDGSNDAPAIRLADVGIGVAGHGSAVARNAADIVLADPDMRRIVDAVLEGRALWISVRDAVSILVGGNAGEVAFTLLATAIGGRAPLRTRQFLLVNLLTDMLPSLAVALAPVKAADDEAQPLTAGPVPSVLGPELARTIAVRGAATALGAILAWQIGSLTGRRRRASTMALAALVGTELGQTLATSSHSPLVISTVVVSAAILTAIVETPGVSDFFECTPLGPVAWATVLASASVATLAAVIASRAVSQTYPTTGQAAGPTAIPTTEEATEEATEENIDESLEHG